MAYYGYKTGYYASHAVPGATLYPVPPVGGSYVPSPTLTLSPYPVSYLLQPPAPAVTTHTYVMSPRQEKVVYSVVSPRSMPLEVSLEPSQSERQVLVHDVGQGGGGVGVVVEKHRRRPVIQHHGHKTVIKDGQDRITIRDKGKEVVIKEKIPYVYDCYHGYGGWCGGAGDLQGDTTSRRVLQREATARTRAQLDINTLSSLSNKHVNFCLKNQTRTVK